MTPHNHPYYRMRAEKWRTLRLAGMTIREIAERYHYESKTVLKELKRLEDTNALHE